MTPAILWFRNDLRLADNPALLAAIASARPVLPLYILDESAPFAPGGASRWWLHHSLDALSRDLAARGAPLVLARGGAGAVIGKLLEETGAAAVYWNRRYEPAAIARDSAIKAELKGQGVEVHSFNASLLNEPWEMTTQAGGPFKVFTPYWRAAQQRPVDAPAGRAPDRITGAAVPGDVLADWNLLPARPNWAAGFAAWTPGEAGALDALDDFLGRAVGGYKARRDLPGVTGTSRLSPHLAFGEISPRQVFSAMAMREIDGDGAATFRSELGWREFAHHVLFHFPSMPDVNLRDGFDAFPWRDDPAGLLAWQTGMTGYPLVDAGMRELWTTGWMHNRVRMIVASFLIKDLMIDWRRGAEWFWDTLVDADLAANAFNWQWVAGCGFDAAPYFRVFNPSGQGERFDEAGKYVRRWCPELARVPDKWIHRPWEAPDLELRALGVVLGRDYPRPIVDHAMARDRALAAFKGLRE